MDNPIRLHWLDPRNPRQPFPSPHLAMRDPNGLLAIGGDLSATRLLAAYAQGIFPWYNPDEPILWWCPDPRAVMKPGEFHVSRSLAKRLRKPDFAVTIDKNFAGVLEGCGGPRLRRGAAEAVNRTWLGSEMKAAYQDLHERGHAHSVEVWRDGSLIGGIYGVSLGGAFFGESMFSRADDASKIAMACLCRQLVAWDFDMLDCQVASGHLATLGAVEIPRSAFLAQLRESAARPARTGRWQFSIDVPADPKHLPGAQP